MEFADALQIRRELALKNPEAYRPDVAKTLNDLGFSIATATGRTEARTEFVEALQIYAVFAEQEPERFSADVTQGERSC